MPDLFADSISGLESPAANIAAVTPSDTVDLPSASRALNVAVEGTVRVTTVSGTTGTVFVSAGGAFPIRCRRIWATGTSATGIVALF